MVSFESMDIETRWVWTAETYCCFADLNGCGQTRDSHDVTDGRDTSHIHGDCDRAESIAEAETTGCNGNAEMGGRGIRCNSRYSQRCCFDSAESS